MTNLDSILKSRDVTLLTKICVLQSYSFSSGRVWMWELDHKESWVPKNWCFWTVLLEKTLESPLDCKEIHPKGNQSWIFIQRAEAVAETPILWPHDVKNWLIGKIPWCWERLEVGGKGSNRRQDGWMTSLTEWMWLWAHSRRVWRTRKTCMLQFMGFQRVKHDLAAEQHQYHF